MDKKFTSNDLPLSDLLDRAKSGALQLPDFQRGWVWDDDHIVSLLASISRSYPIGAVMTLQTGNPSVRFKPRPIEGVAFDTVIEPEYLLLDGQQRTTSLFLALRSRLPVPTRDSRKNELSRRYFADMRACIDPNQDREDAIISVPADGILRKTRLGTAIDVSTQPAQIAAELFPLEIIFEYSEMTSWQLEYFAEGPGNQTERLKTWTSFNEAVLNSFMHYRVPSIELSRATPKEAVCQVFEKVNTGGVSLTVFELLTATYAADNFNLREDWEMRRNRLESLPLLGAFQATDFLQVVTLLTSLGRRTKFIEKYPADDRPPAVTCKRKDILALTLEDYQEWADSITETMSRVVQFLHRERIFKSQDLPYTTQVIPLTAILVALGEKGRTQKTANLLRQWFWCGVFGEMYGGSTDTRIGNDLQDFVAWVGGGDEPRTVRESQFQAARLLNLRTRSSAAYKGLYAQQMARGGRDFRTGNPIDFQTYVDEAMDVRHIFPQKWCSEQGIDPNIANCIVNKTTIDAITSRQMGGRAPSTYLASIEEFDETTADEIDAILKSHDIDPIALRNDDFAVFFNARFERLIKQIEEVTQKPVNRSSDGSESPFASPNSEDEVAQVLSIIERGESKVVEFKSTGRTDLRTGGKESEMEWTVVKTLAGFMNGHGGTLLVGVDDSGSVLGIQNDYPHVQGRNRDGWELWLTDCIDRALGKVAAADLVTTFAEFPTGTVARVDVGPASQPVFASFTSKKDHKNEFLVRINNSTREMQGEEAHKYQKSRWPQ